MDNDIFTKGYFKLLAAKMSPHGYEPKHLVDAIWTGLESQDFELYTTYENIGYCKPNPEYYKYISAYPRGSFEQLLGYVNELF